MHENKNKNKIHSNNLSITHFKLHNTHDATIKHNKTLALIMATTPTKII